MSVRKIPFLMILYLLPLVGPAIAQSGLIGFTDICLGGAYVMRGDGTGRVRLPGGLYVYDISRGIHPTTVLTSGLLAVKVSEVGGKLIPGIPYSLVRPGETDGVGVGALSPTGNWVAYSTYEPNTTHDGIKSFWLADLVKSSSGEIVGATNHRVLVHGKDVGSSKDSISGENTNLSFITFSPDGRALVVGSYGDLWWLNLNINGTLAGNPQPLTRTRKRSESYPSFSADGTKLAFSAGDIALNKLSGNYILKNLNIYVLDLITGTTSGPLVNKSRQGKAQSYFRSPTWSPDGNYIAFWANGPKARGNAPCSYAVNTDIFVIPFDGSAPAVSLSNTVGNGVEQSPRWGW